MAQKNDLDWDDILNDNDDLDDDDNPVDDDALDELKTQIDNLEKEKQGLYHNVKGERRKRQELQTKLDKLSSKVEDILTKTSQAAAAKTGDDAKKSKGLAVQYDEDGNPYLPDDALLNFAAPYQKRIDELTNYIANLQSATKADREVDTFIQDAVSEDESYQPAYSEYKKAFKWANNKVVEFMDENDIKQPLSSGQALDHVLSNPDVVEEFNKKFPAMADKLDVIVTAEDSKTLFKRMLKTVSAGLQEAGKPKVDPNFKKLLTKPSGLSNAKNQKAAEVSILDKLDSLTAEDYAEMSDDQIAALDELMRKEELSAGIK